MRIIIERKSDYLHMPIEKRPFAIPTIHEGAEVFKANGKNYVAFYEKLTHIYDSICETEEHRSAICYDIINPDERFTLDDIKEYFNELQPVNAEKKITKTLKMFYLGTDYWGRHTYEADNGTIWKFTDLKPREDCERLDILCSASHFDGEPDCHIRSDINVEFCPKDGKTVKVEYVMKWSADSDGWKTVSHPLYPSEVDEYIRRAKAKANPPYTEISNIKIIEEE